jgi:hypothetical protein
MAGVSGTGTGGAISVGTSAATLIAASSRRKSVLLQNVHATNKLYIGLADTVTTSTGVRLNPGEAIEFEDYLGPVYAIADGASTDVRYIQVGGYV